MNRWGGPLLAVVCACTTPAPHRAPQENVPSSEVTTLFITADVRGYLAPCGCSENMLGGIARAAFQIAKARDEGHPVFFIDSGNALFAATTIAPEAVPQQERKAHALARAFEAMGLTGRAVGPLDDARGPDFRASLGLKELGPRHFLTPQIAVVTASTLEGATAQAAHVRRQGARFVVALMQQSFDATLPARFGSPSGPDLFVAALAKDELSTEENKLVGDHIRVAQIQSKGRSLLRIDVTLRPGGSKLQWLRTGADQARELLALAQRVELLRAQVNEPMLTDVLKALRKAKLDEVIARREALAAKPLPQPRDQSSVSARFIALEASFEQLDSVKAIVTDYDRDVGQLNLAWAQAHGHDCESPPQTGAGFAGSSACVGCHAAAAKVWQATKHAVAYQALEAVGKNNHLDCVGCHLTGWQQPGGVCRIDRVAGRAEVGCEACHGPGSKHVAVPTKATITRAANVTTCVRCHDRENAPHFVFDTYLEKTLGPGHGR